jgi:hypothetical protein
VLSGTPLENRIDELYSFVEFIDDRRLGPDFRFYQRHRVLDDNGRVIGYQRLEVLLGAKPDAALDESQHREVDRQARSVADRQRMAEAGGQLLGAAFQFLGQMLPPQPDSPESKLLATDLKQRFSECIEQDEAGKPKLTITLPDTAVLDELAESLARLLSIRPVNQ